jgi:tetratricopeptide (TPR) repeat protein
LTNNSPAPDPAPRPDRPAPGIGLALLLVNSAYLAISASPSIFHYANVGLHVFGGVVVLGVLVAGARRWRAWSSPALVAGIVLAAAAVSGAWLAWVGASRAQQAAVNAHGLLAIAATLAIAGAAASTALRARGAERTRLAAVAALLVLAVAGSVVAQSLARQRFAAGYRITNPLAAPLTMDEEGGGPKGPFFPSSSRTNVGGTIPSNFFMTSATCARCHKDIYDQWHSSAHHFSSFNNQWYRKSIEYMQDVVGTRPSKWCAGCHDHAVLFNGRFDTPIREQIDTPEAQAGLACTSCHSIVHVGSTMGQGGFTVEYPPLHDLAVSDNPILMRAHDALLHWSPEPHRNTFLKPFHREQTADFCSTCHKVHLDVPVNGYRWIRGFNDYDNWQASGVSGQGARSFYYPAAPQRCADCHMPLVASNDPAAKNGRVRSHRFPGANTALPFVNNDPVQLKVVQDFLRDGQISVDVFGITRGAEASTAATVARSGEPRLASTFAVGEESAQVAAAVNLAPPAAVLAPLDKVPVTVRRGESVRVEVVVRTRKVGHFFPGGTVDAFDVWVEFEAIDDRGRVLMHSGSVGAGGKGPVEPGAHFYRSLQLDEHGNPINKRNAFMTRSVAYVRLVPPGAADTIHYRLQIPADAGDRIELRAKVNYRKFAWWNTQWAFAGVRDPADPNPSVGPGHDDGRWLFTGDTSKVSGTIKAIPDIPTTVMAESRASLAVIAANAPLPEARPLLDPSVRERWNDYGIGLLLQGDLKGAEAAFRHVMRMDPPYADGPVNVARVLVQEGDVEAAIPLLEKALALSPGLAKAQYFLGTALKSLGRYDEAVVQLSAAAATYPRDRVVLDQLGRVLFLQRKFQEAIAMFERVLLVDPEDLQAHYNLMLCYRGVGDDTRAMREEALYLRFKADEPSQAITGPYRLASPDDNNERQQIHEHRPGGRPK